MRFVEELGIDQRYQFHPSERKRVQTAWGLIDAFMLKQRLELQRGRC